MRGITQTLGVALLVLVVSTTFAQKKITGIVYRDGEPAAGIVVDANKSSDSYYTSFDGKYEIEVSEKSKWIRFTYGDEAKKIDLLINTSNLINFNWDEGKVLSGDDVETEEIGINLKDMATLQKERDMDFLNNYSLYREFFKQNDYKSGMANFRFIYEKYPKSHVQIYRDALAYYDMKKEEAMAAEDKKVYIDSMMLVYDRKIKYMDTKEIDLALKASTYLKEVLVLDLDEEEMTEAIKTGYEYAEKSFNTSKENSEPAILLLYFKSTCKLYSVDEIEKSKVLENYETIMDVVDLQMANEETKEKVEPIISLLEQTIEQTGVLDCEGIVELYQPKFETNPNDIQLIKKILYKLRKSDCTGEALFTQAAEKLYKLEPSAEAAVNMARMFLKKKELEKASEYYTKAIDTETDNTLKATYLYEVASLALQEGNIKKAREHAKSALALKPDYCEVYLLLGEIYAQASKNFEGNDFQKSTVFWVAVDYFEKAAKYSDCAENGKSKANFYSSYFPGKEVVFFEGLAVGAKYSVDGWINEITTIRVKE